MERHILHKTRSGRPWKISIPTSSGFRFLDLPAELRLMIYDQLAGFPRRLLLITPSKILDQRPEEYSTLSAVSATCRRLAEEVREYLLARRERYVRVDDRDSYLESFTDVSKIRPVSDIAVVSKQLRTVQLTIRVDQVPSRAFARRVRQVLETLEASDNLATLDSKISASFLVLNREFSTGILRLKMEAFKGGERDNKARELQFVRAALALTGEAFA